MGFKLTFEWYLFKVKSTEQDPNFSNLLMTFIIASNSKFSFFKDRNNMEIRDINPIQESYPDLPSVLVLNCTAIFTGERGHAVHVQSVCYRETVCAGHVPLHGQGHLH